MQASGVSCRENAKLHPAVIASAAKQSTAPQKGKNGLLRFARNDVDKPGRPGHVAFAKYDDPHGAERVFARLEP